MSLNSQSCDYSKIVEKLFKKSFHARKLFKELLSWDNFLSSGERIGEIGSHLYNSKASGKSCKHQHLSFLRAPSKSGKVSVVPASSKIQQQALILSLPEEFFKSIHINNILFNSQLFLLVVIPLFVKNIFISSFGLDLGVLLWFFFQ